MSEWLHTLPVVWMTAVVFLITYAVAGGIHWVITGLATGERARALKGVSPGLLPPLGIIFGLLVAFLASQAWGDDERASMAVNREASALRAAVLLSEVLPADAGGRVRELIRQHIRQAESQEWPAMARHEVTLTMMPAALSEALQVIVGAPIDGAGQIAAQREILAALENALDARRQRILMSQGHVNTVKWATLILQAICMLVAVAMVHADNRPAARIALGLFSTAIAVSVVLILAHDRPFTGPNAVQPTALLQVLPEPGNAAAPHGERR
jgi:hypothetical protein